MEEYIRILLEQIRCKKAHPAIEQELRAHIEDQTEANLLSGMPKDAAVASAVRDMGDPVETGTALDRIHRPQTDWRMLFVMALVSLLNILVHTFIGHNYDYIKETVLHTLLGFAIMLVCYRLDYSFFVRYAKVLALGLYAVLYLGVFRLGDTVHGATIRISLGGLHLSLIYLSFLCVPLYGALLYHYRGTGYRSICKLLGWMLFPVWISMNIPCVSHAMLLFFMMALLLSLATRQGWFRIDHRKFLTAFWSVILLFPALWIVCGVMFHFFADYQIVRIQAFFSRKDSGYNYVAGLLKEYLSGSRLIGNSGQEIAGYLPEYNSSYILTCLSAYYGIAAALLICCLVLFIGSRIFHISLHQKNVCGRMIGCGCGLVFLCNTAVNILENLGLLPLTQTFLPFFSRGGSGILISYILTGIFLSIYRYQNIPQNIVSRQKQRPD